MVFLLRKIACFVGTHVTADQAIQVTAAQKWPQAIFTCFSRRIVVAVSY